VVASVDGGDALAQRLEDQGLWAGVEVRRAAHAPFGDPILFVLHGYRLALRVDEARRVRLMPRSGS
jgi:Fe2+ transport system protein FeoA